ncbi:MAG: MoxR family ATPase [Firmicutes bacterium]|nr:MoxR family ATPase [Bacillota bacterium]
MEEKIKLLNELFEKTRQEIGKAIIGQKEIIDFVLIGMTAGGNVLLEGLPGLGKTQLVKTIGKVLDMSFSRIQFTPDLMPSDITGTDIFVKEEQSFVFRKGPVFANIVLADEINRATPKTQSALLEAMQERTVTVGKDTYKLPDPFFVLATQNPIESEGTYPLPEAQLDRFMFKLNVAFPTAKELADIVSLTTANTQTEPQKVADSSLFAQIREIANQIPTADAVMDFAMNLIVKTHPENGWETAKKYILSGASPRAAQAIITSSRILAVLNGRYNVSFDDVKKVAKPVLCHRLLLNFEALSDGVTAEDIVDKLLSEK